MDGHSKEAEVSSQVPGGHVSDDRILSSSLSILGGACVLYLIKAFVWRSV